jgi:hypothetical protein
MQQKMRSTAQVGTCISGQPHHLSNHGFAARMIDCSRRGCGGVQQKGIRAGQQMILHKSCAVRVWGTKCCAGASAAVLLQLTLLPCSQTRREEVVGSNSRFLQGPATDPKHVQQLLVPACKL